MSERQIEAIVEDPKRRLLDVCRHTAPACWACVAKDMDRQRDEAEAEVAKLTAQRTMTVHRLGGEVEGAQTHAGNFLQRIDALRAIEADSGERVRALEEGFRDGIEAAARWCDTASDIEDPAYRSAYGCAARHIRALAPSPRSEAGRTEVGGNYWPSADEVEVPCPGWPDCEYVQNPPGHKHYAPSAPVPAESAGTREVKP